MSASALINTHQTNNKRLFGTDNPTFYVKDGINGCVVAGKHDAVNPENKGTKTVAHYRLHVHARSSATVRLRLSKGTPLARDPFGSPQTVATRKKAY
jgi:hypothetical protein